jgi:hypothetical protein
VGCKEISADLYIFLGWRSVVEWLGRLAQERHRVRVPVVSVHLSPHVHWCSYQRLKGV